jgi:hypothetical protein
MKMQRIRDKLQCAPGAAPVKRADAWQSALLQGIAERTSVTMPRNAKAARELCTKLAQERGRAVAYYSTSAKAWRVGCLRGTLNAPDVEEEAKRQGLDSVTGEKRAAGYLKGTCVWLEFAEAGETGIVACPVSAIVGAATTTRNRRSLYFLDLTVDDYEGPEGGLAEHGALRRQDVFHIGDGGLQGWCQCELCCSWRKVEDEMYRACEFDGAPFTCKGGCKSPLSPDERRFAPLDAPGRENKRLTRKR